MILTIPTIYLEKGKSKHSIHGLPGFELLDKKFKNDPLELAKLFREENNKSILIDIDETEESIFVLKSILNILDIPIQIYTRNSKDEFINKIEKMGIRRIFMPINIRVDKSFVIPVIKFTELHNSNISNFERVMIDFEGTSYKEINIDSNVKTSIINLNCSTTDLIEINKMKTGIDSIYLGKDYYGVHFAGQLLWRIAEKAQFNI
ncbi:MAG: hypothetical protein R2863_01055 [Candidatus Kapaibacterium sp.]|nr:hypothetical protein [Ignavibacteriota bacterium]